MTSILPAVVLSLAVAGSLVGVVLQLALYRRMRLHYPDLWRSFPRTDVHPFIGFPVLRFVKSGYFRSVPDQRVLRLGTAILWLNRGLNAVVLITILVVIWSVVRSSSAGS